MPGSKLLARIHEIQERAHIMEVAVSFHDLDSHLRFAFQGERVFHAASTYKAGILFALFKAVEAGVIRLDDPLQIRNRFLSIIDGSPYRIGKESDGDGSVHRAIGRSLSVHRLAHAMITRSSNLATNLLLDLLGIDLIRTCLAAAGVTGLEVRRGVEDLAAYQQGISNEATADGLLRLFRLFLDDAALRPDLRQQALDILHAQEFNSMIPAKMPSGVKVAHKTGEISTHCHDAGLVFTPGREPYVLAILTQTGPETEKRQRAVAEIAHVVHRYVTSGEKPA